MLYVTAPDNVWAIDARDGRELWRYFWKTRGGTHIGNRGAAMWQQLPVLRNARQLSRVARRADRQGALARRDRRLQSAVLLDDGADRRRQPRAGRDGQRPRRARIPAVLRSGNRQAAVDLLHRADEAGRSRPRHVAEPRPPRSTAAARSGSPASTIRENEALHLRHRQPDAGLHRRRPQGRQPLHLLAGRRERRYRQDGVVLPDVAARHARLGLGADADPHRRRRSTAGRASSSPPRRATATSSPSIASPASTSSRPSTATTTNWARASGRRESPSRTRRRKRRFPARSCRRSKAASPTGSRRPTRRTPGLFYIAGEQRLQHAVPDRSRSARLDGARRQAVASARLGRQRPDGHRSEDRQDRVASRLAAGGGGGAAC